MPYEFTPHRHRCPRCGYNFSTHDKPAASLRVGIRQSILQNILAYVKDSTNTTVADIANAVFPDDPSGILRARGFLFYMKKNLLLHHSLGTTHTRFWVITKTGTKALRRLKAGKPWQP